jgi:hypothetical protein
MICRLNNRITIVFHPFAADFRKRLFSKHSKKGVMTLFFFFAITSATEKLGLRRCGRFPCCGTGNVPVLVTCVSRRFLLFFIPLFRFGKRYFVSCPNCRAVYEIRKDEGRRIERDPSAEIDPEKIFRISGPPVRFCPNCGTRVDPGSRYCPSCGRKL